MYLELFSFFLRHSKIRTWGRNWGWGMWQRLSQVRSIHWFIFWAICLRNLSWRRRCWTSCWWHFFKFKKFVEHEFGAFCLGFSRTFVVLENFPATQGACRDQALIHRFLLSSFFDNALLVWFKNTSKLYVVFQEKVVFA